MAEKSLGIMCTRIQITEGWFSHRYPGDRAAGSFVLIDNGHQGTVHLMSFADGADPLSAYAFVDGSFRRVNDLLKEMGTPSMEEQFAVMGYGANPCPGLALNKMRQAAIKGNVQTAMTVFRGSMIDYDPVASEFFEGGYIPASLARSEGTAFEAWLTLYTKDLLQVINDSEDLGRESLGYDMMRGVEFWIDGMTSPIKPATYLAKKNLFSINLPTGYQGPVSFANIPSINRIFPETTEDDLVSLVISQMAKLDHRYDINTLLLERGIEFSEGDKNESKIIRLMTHINAKGRHIYARLADKDKQLVGDIRNYMREKSQPFKLYGDMEENGRLISKEEAYEGPEEVRFKRLLNP